jgi:hypothetical protein
VLLGESESAVGGVGAVSVADEEQVLDPGFAGALKNDVAVVSETRAVEMAVGIDEHRFANT